tara:strand:- start:50 stop:568 length:519 start_codon:yes stop_codon:yes gene_type:complete
MEYTAGGTHAPAGRIGPITQSKSNYYVRMQYPDDYRMEETKIMKFERDYANNLEYTFFNLFPQNLGAVQVGYDASKILTASCAFEYTRYVCGPISNISKYRSGNGYNNLTVADIKERLQSQTDITNNDVEDRSRNTEDQTISLSGGKKEVKVRKKSQYQINRDKLNASRRNR